MLEKLNDLDIIRKLENEIGKKLEILEPDQIVNDKGGKYGYTMDNDAVIGLKMQQMSIRDIYLLGELKNLKLLNLLRNNISDISPLKNLIKLEQLSLSGNKISDISYLENLKNLSELFLSSNQITDISPLYSLMGLKRLTVRNNKISTLTAKILDFEMDIKWDEDYKPGFVLGGNPFTEPPIETVKRGKQALKEYFQSIDSSIKVDIDNKRETGKVEQATSSSRKPEIPAPPNIHDMDREPVIGAKELAEELADLLDNQSSDKATMVGIFGHWGRGKSFLMEHIWKQLEKKDKKTNFERVDFHAWKYQDTPASWAYLYEAFANKYFEMPQRQNGKVLHFIWEYIKTWINNCFKRIKINLEAHGWFPLAAFIVSVFGSITWALLNLDEKASLIYYISRILLFSMPVIMYIFSKIFIIYRKSAIQLFKKYTKKRSYSQLLGIQKEIQDELRILLKAWLPEEKRKKILLIVDDLDRCSEERLIQVIDSLRVMLEDTIISKRVFALIAVDDRILVRAIHLKYQRILENSEDLEKLSVSMLTQEYFDKLFLIGVKLCPLIESEKEAIMYSIIKDKLAPITRSESALPSMEEVLNASKPVIGSETIETSASPNLTEMYYKISPSLVDNKKIKKLPSPILENLRKHENIAMVNNDFIEILNSLNIPKDETELILKHSEFQPELNEEEYIRFLKLLPFLESATPRSIRILYYQYILAKRLLKKFKPIYTFLSQKNYEELASNGSNGLLDLLFLKYRYRTPERKDLLNKYLSERDFDKCLEDFSKDFPGNEEINNIIQRIKEIEHDTIKRMQCIIDIVVAY